MASGKSTRYVYTYLHGMFSGPHSRKGQLLSEYLRQHGQYLHQPNLNNADAVPLRISAAMDVLHKFYQDNKLQVAPTNAGPITHGASQHDVRLRIVASSYGGYLAARFAHLHDECVDSLILLCPAFNPNFHFRHVFGEIRWAAFERTGQMEMQTGMRPHGAAVSETGWYAVQCPYSIFEDARDNHPPFPLVTCPTHIVHASRDRVISPHSSQEYVDEHRRQLGFHDKDGRPWPLRRETVDDDHFMTSPTSTARIRAVVNAMWKIDSAS
ncbi:uncharacterized protein LOC135829202 [Sycon ciliatum]|uniref:uncharacterized protein LOC135829202 n=1 Tax=Sycon ciliatum TaxID=27933 RepID=UPI0020A8DC0E|eukprot:scpid25204/ scgid21561/ 